MKGASFLAVLFATQHAKRAIADNCPVATGDPVTPTGGGGGGGGGPRCDALVRSVTSAESHSEGCTCYLFCGNELRSCYGGADGSDGAVAAWRRKCDEPLACSVVKEQTRRFLLRPSKERKATEGSSKAEEGLEDDPYLDDGEVEVDDLDFNSTGTGEGGRTRGGNSTDWIDSADGYDDPDGGNSTGKDDSLDGIDTEDDGGYNSTDGDMSPSEDYGEMGQMNSSAFALEAGGTSASPATVVWSVLGVVVSVTASLAQVFT